jgi:threonine synthase
MVPIGAGSLLTGLYKAFCELIGFGVIEKMPKLAGVQSDRCCPITKAFLDGSDRVDSWNMRENTIASGLNDELRGYTQDGERTLLHIRLSGGYSIALSEEEIVESTILLGKQGIFAEPAGASGIVAAKRLREDNVIKAGESVVVIATGNGLKNPIEMVYSPESATDPTELFDRS